MGPDPGFASCCILSYERFDFIKKMIESMVASAEYPMEIIVHDDGSTDRRVTMYLDKLVREGAISHLILNPPGNNEGQGIALNRMFHMAKGDPIIKLDQDLIFGPGWLRKSKAILDENWNVSGAPPQEPTIGALGLFKYEVDPVDHREMFIEQHREGEVTSWEEHKDFVGSAMVIPRAAWEEFGPFEERSEAFAEDNTFKLAVAEATGWAVGLPREDLATNVGFGLGPSTVVVQKEDGELTSREIKKGPVIV